MRLCEEKVKSGGKYGEISSDLLFAIVRIRCAIRTCNTDSGPSPSPEGEGMARANSKPGCQTTSEAHICPLLPLREKGWG